MGADLGGDWRDGDDISVELLQRANRVHLHGIDLPVATVEDLLLLKLEANRHIDLDDAIAIKDAFGEALDRAYIDRWAKTLGIEDREAILG